MQFFKIIAISSGLGTEKTPTVNCTVVVYHNTVYRKKLSFLKSDKDWNPIICVLQKLDQYSEGVCLNQY